jgi:hypothetical protein
MNFNPYKPFRAARPDWTVYGRDMEGMPVEHHSTEFEFFTDDVPRCAGWNLDYLVAKDRNKWEDVWKIVHRYWNIIRAKS